MLPQPVYRRAASLLLVAVVSEVWLGFAAAQSVVEEGNPQKVDFSREIAPLLTERCLACHNPSQAKGGLDLSTSKSALAGGENGTSLVPGKPEESWLLDMLASGANGSRPEMPKKGEPLTAEQVALLRRWIAEGASWPAEVMLREKAKADASWWAFQPLATAEPPACDDAPLEWHKNPIDCFVYTKLKEQGLSPSPPADARTLVRRATYDLTGLPPTAEEVEDFVQSASRNPQSAIEALIDRLLSSPHYGEHWGRHWLDVIRFGESRGFERNEIVTTAWPFRDYIIDSLNADKPFDQLVREHLAGDAIGKDQPGIEIGTTFLVCGPYDDVGNQDPIQAATIRANTLDDIIRATSEAFLGLTTGCARCHDHKFDPIRQEDYYALYATFAGVRHGNRDIATAEMRHAREKMLRPLEAERKHLAEKKEQLDAEVSARVAVDSAEIEAAFIRPAARFELIEETFAPVTACQVRLIVEGTSANPASGSSYSIDEFEIFTAEAMPRNVALASAGAKAFGQQRQAEDFTEAYSAALAIDGKYAATFNAQGPELRITLKRPERIERVAFSSNRNGDFKKPFPVEYRIEVSADGQKWTEVASGRDRQPATTEQRTKRLADAVTTDDESRKLASLRGELAKVDAKIATVPPLPSWWAGQFSEASGPFPVFLGGDPQRKGPAADVASLAVLDGQTSGYHLPATAKESERRVALAEWLVDPRNPLTPRVLANRVWHYHFGTGIVDTPSDFGYLGGRPTHPELLDWLARRLRAHGWRLKALHREIMLSQTYRQSGAFRTDAAQIDSAARLLWRFPPRRLSAEEVRDTMLSVAGKLDTRRGGPGFRLYKYLQDNVATYVPLDEFGPDTYRRAIYHHAARASRIDLLSDFDCPDNAFAAPTRAATTTPLQALTLLNHDFTLDMAAALAERLQREAGNDNATQVRRALAVAFSREASVEEVRAATNLIERHGVKAFCRALLNANELVYLD